MLPQAARRDAGLKLLAFAREATLAAEQVLRDATAAVRARVSVETHTVGRLFDREQRATHGLAWLATYVEAIRQVTAFAERLHDVGPMAEVDELTIQIGLGEYLAQIQGGIPMSPGEVRAAADFGLSAAAVAERMAGPLEVLTGSGNAERRARLVALLKSANDVTIGGSGVDEQLASIRDEMRKFTDSEIATRAQGWHLANELIPFDIIAYLGELGVFALTIPESFGGMGLGKEAMCVVSEELSRGYLGVGSLGTRSEIAAELIRDRRHRGAEAQMAAADRDRCRTADGSLYRAGCRLRPCLDQDARDEARRRLPHPRQQDLDHACRARRPDAAAWCAPTPKESGHQGLSMLLAEKPRGNDANPFPVRGMSGTEIEVLGYRGMKEYEIAFDGFEVKAENLLGGIEGRGFKQLMQTFEAARIQTAARSVGVAQAALEAALGYARERRQFGEPIVNFPRVADKLAMMAAEIMMARQLTYFAARRKDSGRRCDLEAGMAKLLAARVAWSAADNAVQIHGGNGFALEFPVSRLLCDARVLSIFEGAAEIQAQVIARRLLEADNS